MSARGSSVERGVRRLLASGPVAALAIWLLLTLRPGLAAATEVHARWAAVFGWTSALFAALVALLAAGHLTAIPRSPRNAVVLWSLAVTMPWVAMLEGLAVVAAAGTVDRTTSFLGTLASGFAIAGLVAGVLIAPRLDVGRRLIAGVAAAGVGVGVLSGLFLVGVLDVPRPWSNALVARPWDLPALLLVAAAGFVVFPRLARTRSWLGRALVWCTIPLALERGPLVFGAELAGPATMGWPFRALAWVPLLVALFFELWTRERRREVHTQEVETARQELTRQTEELLRVDRELVLQASKRRLAERSLRMLETAVETMSIGVTVNDPEGTILYVNPAGAAMHGYAVGKLRGANISRLWPDDVPVPSAGERIADGAAPWVREAEHVTRDGRTFPVRLVSDAVVDDGQLLAVVTSCEDITERRQVEQMKHDFISTVSHELRTPLTSIIASLGLLDGSALRTDPGHSAELVAVAHRNSQRLLQLINDLLDLQKLSAGKLALTLEAIDVGDMLEEAIAGIAAFADEYRVELRLEPLARPLLAFADRRRLIQVVLNLVSNAIKFSPAGAEVTVAARPVEGRVVLSVADRGPGIPDAYQQAVFERFTQIDGSTTRRSGGSGLGLTIARELVEAMEGTIGLDTEVGTGTTFFVDLALVEPPPPDEAFLEAH